MTKEQFNTLTNLYKLAYEHKLSFTRLKKEIIKAEKECSEYFYTRGKEDKNLCEYTEKLNNLRLLCV